MKIRTLIYFILTILIITFIFINSLANGTESANLSGNFLNLINNSLQKLNIDFRFSGNYLRKFAHLFEFMLLGIFLFLTIDSINNNFLKSISPTLFLGLIIPVIDETIQIFSEGRSSQVSDIWIDFIGVSIGIFLISISKTIFEKIDFSK